MLAHKTLQSWTLRKILKEINLEKFKCKILFLFIFIFLLLLLFQF